MKAEIIAVGTELLLGEILNTDAQFLASELSKIGIDVYYQSVVGDNEARLKGAIKTSLERSDIVITSGGLGPTNDDITKEIIADVMGVGLELDQKSLDNMESYFKKLGRIMSQNNKKQAFMPKGCIVLDNHNGTAPGGIIEKDGKIAIFLPGPPNELVPMYKESVEPYLREKSDSVLYSKTLRIVGVGESVVAQKLSDLLCESTNPTVAPYAKTGEATLRITAKCKDEDEAVKMIEPVEEKIRAVLGEAVYGINDETIFSVVCDMLKKYNMKVSFAESCTGGMAAEKLTDISGSSKVFEQGFVTYSDTAKQKMLGVKGKTLEKYGAVSEQTAMEMARGAIEKSDADVAVSVTGVAGPDSDERQNPVGLVYIGLADKSSSYARKFMFSGSREKIRHTACMNVFIMLREYFMKNILTK